MTNEVDAAKKAWNEHCLSALREFISSAVIIDNEPYLPECGGAEAAAPQRAALADEGMPVAGEELLKENGPTTPLSLRTGEGVPSGSGKEPEDHRLDIRATSDAFAASGILCAFVLPRDETVDSTESTKRVLQAAETADIVVIDWYLKDKNPVTTKEILKKIAKKDAGENGRLRLICVYTGQTNVEIILKDAMAALTDGGLQFEEPGDGFARGAHHCVVVLNKRDVRPEQLPDELLKRMAILTGGLLPSFALASVAAIRRNVHHLVTQFPETLDAAFVANRLICDPPDGIVELMRELFLSDCDTALDLSQVSRRHLDRVAITKWLATRNVSDCSYKLTEPTGEGGKEIKINKTFISALLNSGLNDDGKLVLGEECVSFPEDRREKISAALYGGKKPRDARELEFSRKTVLKREAFGLPRLSFEEGWTPILTLGTVLRVDGVSDDEAKWSKYLYCLTPACDTLRIPADGITFVMVELSPHHTSNGKFNLVISDETGAPIKLHYVPKTRHVRAFTFDDVDGGRVRARKESDQKFYFQACGSPKLEFLWLGEVRRHRANRDMADLNREWLRLGVNDSEYLRLKAR